MTFEKTSQTPLPNAFYYRTKRSPSGKYRQSKFKQIAEAIINSVDTNDFSYFAS